MQLLAYKRSVEVELEYNKNTRSVVGLPEQSHRYAVYSNSLQSQTVKKQCTLAVTV